LVKPPKNNQEKAYWLAGKMAGVAQKLSPSVRAMAKMVKKVKEDLDDTKM
jgi:hypothetical protein